MKKLLPIIAFIGFLMTSTAFSQDPEEQLWCEYPATEGPGASKHIVLLAGDDEYRSEEAMPMLGKLLSQRFGFKCTVIFPINPEDGTIKPDHQTNMPGMEALAEADLVIMGLRFRNLPDDQMVHFDRYLSSGKPIIGLRTSTHAFNIPQDSDATYKHYSYNSGEKWIGGFGQQVLGDTWINHHGRHKVESTAGVIEAEFADHPILSGVSDIWGPTDVYGIRNLPDSANVLVRGAVLEGMEQGGKPVEGKKNDPMMPLVWTKSFEHPDGNTNKIVCTTMGSSNDLANEGLRRLVINSAFWLLEMENEITADMNVEPIGEYNPSMYGFGTYAKGTKPSAHNLDE